MPSSLPLAGPPADPPPGAPPQWAYMSWHARKAWMDRGYARQRAARIATIIGTHGGAPPAEPVEPPAPEPEPEPAEPARDHMGRRIWTDEQIRAARAAAAAARRGAGPPLDDDQKDAILAYKRNVAVARRHAQGAVSRSFRPRQQTLQLVLEMSAFTPEEIAERLGVNLDTVANALTRCDRRDLARPFWRARSKARRKT